MDPWHPQSKLSFIRNDCIRQHKHSPSIHKALGTIGRWMQTPRNCRHCHRRDIRENSLPLLTLWLLSKERELFENEYNIERYITLTKVRCDLESPAPVPEKYWYAWTREIPSSLSMSIDEFVRPRLMTAVMTNTAAIIIPTRHLNWAGVEWV